MLDTAKIAALLLMHGGGAAEFLSVDNVPGPVLSLIAVPTTSGTGSQAKTTPRTPVAEDLETRLKAGFD